jgi:hypothetical protein
LLQRQYTDKPGGGIKIVCRTNTSVSIFSQ